ncbi:hypothetical protein BJP34_04620 [Moorena producens PAL-8-15-08-1]|uniref:Uncharacterized protein n=2 Tax=Moorena TaxID=1155738 RepID=A0A1D8TMF0_9CYAN|nr:hypothetical protein BJP34_04620 [Moorena producens PAL-8-15-08-1]
MTVLQNRWYNGLITKLQLDPNMFQIPQPSLVLQSSQDLWAYQDVIPPVSLTFNTSIYKSYLFSDEYAAVISELEFPTNKFKQNIGEDNYQRWLTYLENINPPPPERQLPNLFRRWSILNAPSVMSVGVSDLSKMVLISAAQRGLRPYRNPNAKPIDFSGTYAQLVQLLDNSPGGSFDFDSQGSSDDVSNTWTGGYNVGLDGLWAGDSSTSRLNHRFALSSVTVDIQFQSYTVWTSTPGSWYNSSLLNIAYSNKATPPWPINPNPTWDEVFSQDGSIQYFIASLVVMDGVKATITSDVSYSKTDQQTIHRNASKGLWPFYVPTKNGSVTNIVTFGDSKGMKIETVAQPGNPIVIGNNVLGIAQYLGHAPS